MVVITPAHQYSLGVTLGSRRRGELLAWACSGGGIIIEDDYDGELRYDRQPVGAVQALDPGQVIYAGTTSKSLAAALRVGWLAVPPHLTESLVRSAQAVNAAPSSLDLGDYRFGDGPAGDEHGAALVIGYGSPAGHSYRNAVAALGSYLRTRYPPGAPARARNAEAATGSK
jgi:hypothetical protein